MAGSILKLPPTVSISTDQFYDLCRANVDWKLERTSKGDLIVMAPTGGETGVRNSNLNLQLGIWNEKNQLGLVFDSSTGFHLPDGSDRSPDVAWVVRERWDALTPQEREKFPPLAPDFVMELMSPSDNLNDARDKMRDYIDNGVCLGWLLNRDVQQVEIYSPITEVEVLKCPVELSGGSVLPGFVLNLRNFW